MKDLAALITQPHIHQEGRLPHRRTDNGSEVAISKRPEGDGKADGEILPSEVYCDAHGG